MVMTCPAQVHLHVFIVEQHKIQEALLFGQRIREIIVLKAVKVNFPDGMSAGDYASKMKTRKRTPK
jgi:hypothetical protein